MFIYINDYTIILKKKLKIYFLLTINVKIINPFNFYSHLKNHLLESFHLINELFWLTKSTTTVLYYYLIAGRKLTNIFFKHLS